MAFWKLCKNGILMKSKCGDFVDRIDYDNVCRTNNLLRKNLTLNNFNLMVCYILENYNLKPEEKMACNVYFGSLNFFIETLSDKNNTNSDKKEELSSNISKEDINNKS